LQCSHRAALWIAGSSQLGTEQSLNVAAREIYAAVREDANAELGFTEVGLLDTHRALATRVPQQTHPFFGTLSVLPSNVAGEPIGIIAEID
jgi:hypothetical protein